MTLKAVGRAVGSIALLVAGLAAHPLAYADASGPLSPFPLTGAYSAFHKGDRNHISIIEISGNYNKDLAPGQSNVEPRAVIAREFFRTHPDNYDFIVAFSTFEFDTGDATAFHWPVQNKIQGIGLPQFDVSNLFGSQGKLQGFTDMAALSRYSTDPLEPDFEKVLGVMAHEILHQWASHVRFRLPDGSTSDALLGRDNAHWSYLLNSDASVEYGAQWKDNGDGTFTSVGIRKFFSPLDLYLMGFYRKEEVPPFFLIDNPAIDKTQLPQENVTITGTRREVTIDDIIAVEGERVPAADQSQKEFRIAFVLLVGPNQTPSDAQILAMNNIRSAFMTRFAIMTGGRAVAHVYPEALPTEQQGTPTTVSGGELRQGQAIVDDALAWLRARQTAEGYWMDKPTTRLRDTTSALRTLAQVDTGFGGIGQGVLWLGSQASTNTDYLARHATTLVEIGGNASGLRAQLAALQNSDGGWGIAAGYRSNPLDTALAVLALAGFGDVGPTVIDRATQYLLGKQGTDGGWGSVDGGASRTSVTATVLQALKAAAKSNATVNTKAFAWLATKQNPDGGFGDSPSTAHDTANVLQTLMALDALNQVRASDASGYLVSRQTVDGSWEGSTYATSLVVSALKRFNFPNWAVSSPIIASPASPRDGDRVTLTITVRNDGNVAAGASVLRVYDGDPATGGTSIGPDLVIPPMTPHTSYTFAPVWDTFDKAGAHTLVAVVDPDGTQQETSKRDNLATLPITVQPAPDQADLALAVSDIAVTPVQPNRLPTTLGISATIRNSGKTDAANVRVVLWEGAIGTGTLVADTLITVPGRGTAAANFTSVLRNSGTTSFNVQIDPDNVVSEANETNNIATAEVSTAPSVDFEVTAGDISLDKNPAYVGNDVSFRVTLRNRGTLESPSANVRYFITDGNTTTEMRMNTVQIGEGSTTEHTIAWRVDRTGNLTFTAQLDPEGVVPEIDEANNVGSLSFNAATAVGPNLVVSYRDFTFSPNPAHEGYDATLSAVVRNTGNTGATDVAVNFYNGDPATGGVQIGTTQVIPIIAAGASASVSVVWPGVPSPGEKLLFVVADPANAIAEPAEDDNAAFNVLDVLSLPDLAITAGDIQLSPAFPKTGDAVTLSVRVTNLGEQGANAIVVRAFDGDPTAGGAQIGGDQILTHIDGFGAGIVSFNWDLGTSAGPQAVFVQIDPANAVLESNKANNSARKDTAVQDGNLFATNIYFSPDGDGVKDTTQFFFRLGSPTTVSVVVVNKRDKVVRTFSGQEYANIAEGNAIWDGLDDLGRLVSDGTYRLRVLDPTGAVVGETSVYLDTNRSSLLEALDTKYESFTNLTCELPNVDQRQLTQDDEKISFLIYSGTAATSTYPKGVYRMAGNGAEIKAIVPEAWFGANSYPERLAFAANGSAIAFIRTESRYPYQRTLWVADGEGRNLRQVGTSFNNWANLVLSADGTNLFFAGWGRGVRLIPLNGAPERTVYSSDGYGIDPNSLRLSPDGKRLALVDFSIEDYDQQVVVLIDLQAADFAFEEISSRQYNGGFDYAWSRDGSRIAVIDPYAWKIGIYDRNGALVRHIESPFIPGPNQELRMSNLQWAANGSELSFTAYLNDWSGGEGGYGYGGSSAPLDPGGIYVADLLTGTVGKAAAFRPDNGCGECASYHISVWDGARWVERGVLHYDMLYQEKRLDLSSFLPDANGNYRLRIRQQGLEAAHVESVALLVNGVRVLPVSALHLGNSQDVLSKVLYPDREVLDLFGAEMEVRWDSLPGGKIELALNAREEALSQRKTLPFSYPADTTRFYTYVLRGNRPLVVDGNQTSQDGLGEALFKVFSRPGTGHPPADVYGYVQSDGQFLYGALDFTVDNTEDGDKDWGAMRVRTRDGWKEFRVTANDKRYGVVGFIHTGVVHHTHKYYEFKIPLSEIGVAEGDSVDVAFQAYGTAAIVIADPDTGLPNYGTLLWAPGERSLIYHTYEGTFGIFLDENNNVRQIFGDWVYNFNDPEFSPTGRQLLFRSSKATYDPTSTCYQQGWTDDWSYKSLLNLTADVRAIRSAKVGGILLKGTASDLNFSSYTLDYADASNPDVWSPIVPASGQPVVDELFTTWVPPGPGNYFVRLSVEDLAGNKRQTIKRVSWSDTPSITDLYRSPAIISPNGDGIQDAATIHYRVLEPVHLEFNFYNKQGDRVRTIARDHTAIGAEIDLTWDGRDDRGLPVPDGEYRMTVQNYEFFITVDATPPAVAIRLEDAYRPRRIQLAPNVYENIVDFLDSPLVPPTISVPMMWSVSDTNYRDSVVEQGIGESPNAWRLYYEPDPAERGEGKENNLVLRPQDVTGNRFRITAIDLAGIQSSQQTPLAKEELIVYHFGNFGFNPTQRETLGSLYAQGPTRTNLREAIIRMESAPDATSLSGGYFKPTSAVPFVPLDSETVDVNAIQMEVGAARFSVGETIRSGILQLYVQFRKPGESVWHEAMLVDFLSYQQEAIPLTSGGYKTVWMPSLSNAIADFNLTATWNMGGLEPGQTYIVRLRGVDAESDVHYSNAFRFQTAAGLVFMGFPPSPFTQDYAQFFLPALKRNPPEPQEYVLWGKEFISEPLAEVRLYVRSKDDPRYATPRQVDGAFAYPDGSFTFNTSELEPCKTYYAVLEARTDSVIDPVTGRATYRTWTTFEETFSIPCLVIKTNVRPIPAEGCDLPSKNQIEIGLAVQSLSNSELKLLTLSRTLPNVGEDVVFNVNKPESEVIPPPPGEPGYRYRYVLDTSQLPEGTYEFTAKIVDVNDQEMNSAVTVRVDHTPPTLALTYPQDGQQLCGVPVTWPNNTVHNMLPIEGVADDAGGFHYKLEIGEGDSPIAFTQLHDSRTLDSNSKARGGSGVIYPARRDFHTNHEVGQLGALVDRNGQFTVQMRVQDMGGFERCTRKTFYVDGKVERLPATIDRMLFSPNGDALFDDVTVSYEVDEPVTLDIDVLPAARDATTGEIMITGPPVRSLAHGLSLLPGADSMAWDGRDDAGSTVADGLYVIRLAYKDACGNASGQILQAEVDNTPPAVIINYPRTTDPLPLIVEIQGTVQDPHMAGFRVEYGVGSFPDAWVPVSIGSGNVATPAALGVWNTYGLEGAHAIRVVAADTLGNQREVQVPVSLATRLNLISYLEAVPSLFSPNNDGKRETTAVRVGLEQDSVITVAVLNAAGAPVRMLANAKAATKGAVSINWDGRDDSGELLPDGTYTIGLVAALASNPLIKQEEKVTVILDSTAPALGISRPVASFVPAIGGIIGTIQDAHIGDYTVSITDTPAAPTWEVLDSGTDSRMNAVLGSLQDRAEGEYAIRIEAKDQGEIVAQKIVPFVIDNTPPKPAITAPTAGSIVGVKKSPVNITGTLEEKYLDLYRLNVGNGDAPTAWGELANGNTLPLPGVIHAWDVGTLPDGNYTLQLFARDKAGSTGEHRTTVTVDNTPPTALITVPAEGSYVKEPFAVTGSANDAHFVDYRLDVAPGAKGASTRWSEIGTGTQAITNGSLLSWQGLPPDGLYTLKLTAKDAADNQAEALVQVTVDTNPPAAPTNLKAAVENGEDGHLTWNANSEPDLAGYAVYRDGVRITTALVPTPDYVDVSLPEGRYTYTVTAFDRAGWESPKSEPATIVVDITPPTTIISAPNEGSTVSALLDVKGTAYSVDDFKEYRLYVGEGTAPAGWQLLRRSPVPVLADVLSQWNTVVLAEGAQFTLKLEAEDINGNVGNAIAHVTIDNLPPAAPTGLVATATGANVQLAWNANTEPDLLGYLVFRNERIANAQGVVVGSLTPYAVVTTNYPDLSLPDGPYTYTIIAIDRAGNISPPSSPASVTIDTRPPHAVIVQPLEGFAFDQSLYVLATTVDTDVANVQFQYKSPTGTVWTNIDSADANVPYEASWIPASLPYGTYQIRAVATDAGNKVDPAPTPITVVYKDLTKPAVTVGVANQVNGGDVVLSWTANTETDLAGYLIDRTSTNGTTVRLTPTPHAATTYADIGLNDGTYAYTVIAVDTSGNAAAASAPSEALIYTPTIKQPYTPTKDLAVNLQGKGLVQAAVSGEVVNTLGTTALSPLDTDPSGQFVLASVPLAAGNNTITLRLTDPAGNISKSAAVSVVGAARPSPPTGVLATANGLNVDLTWNANPEADIIGYRVLRDDQPVAGDQAAAGLSASASSSWSAPYRAVDGLPWTYWAPVSYNGYPAAGQWFAVAWSQARIVTQLEISWYDIEYLAVDYDVEAWSGSAWVTVAEVRGNTEAVSVVTLAQPYRTVQARIVLRRIKQPDDMYQSVRLGEVRVLHAPYVTTPPFADSTTDGHHRYTVTALNQYGFESAPSAPAQVAVGDVVPPDAVTLAAAVTGADVTLTWSASISPDVARYDVYRDGVLIGAHTDLANLRFVDAGVRNGTYLYVVRAVDAAGNVSTASNDAFATIAVAVPPAPISLAVTPPPGGSALDLSWAPATGSMPSGYRVLRATTAGGPYVPVTDVGSTGMRDAGLTNGVLYYYVVLALDAFGNVSIASNEASGMPLDTVAPTVSLHFPTLPGRLQVTDKAVTNVIGMTEPGALVTLFQNGHSLGEITTAPVAEMRPASFTSYYDSTPLSPDGRHAAFVTENSEIAVYDFEAQTQSIIMTMNEADDRLSWSADGNQLLFVDIDWNTYNYYVGAYRFSDRSVRRLTDPNFGTVANGVLSPEGKTLAVLGEKDGQSGLWRLDLATNTWTLLVSGYVWGFDSRSLEWSPDGRNVVYARYDQNTVVEIVNVDNGSVSLVDDNGGYSYPHWSPDGASVLYTSLRAGFNQVWHYSLATQTTRALTPDNVWSYDPAWIQDGQAFAYTNDNNELRVQSLAEGNVQVITGGDPYAGYLWNLRSVASGYFSTWVDDQVTRIVLPGRFEYKAVMLQSGDNVFTASARDTSGNVGPQAPAIIVNYRIQDRADLVVTDQDVRVLPAAPVQGEAVRISVTVRNMGALASPSADLSLLAIDPSGQTAVLTSGAALNPLAPGASQTLSADWRIEAGAGAYHIVVVVDPANTVVEVSEANNVGLRTLSVAGSAVPQLTVATDKARYDANEDVVASTTITNNGETFDGRVELAIEDSDGYLVRKILSKPVSGVAYAANVTESERWNTGTTFAGSYRAHALLFDNTGALIAEAVSSFTIGAAANLAAHVGTDRALYVANDNVHIIGSISYIAGNSVLTSVEAQVRVTDSAGTVLTDTTRMLGDLLPDGGGEITLDWNTGIAQPGQYLVTLSALQNGTVLATADALFTVAAGNAQLAGTLQVADPAPAAGAAEVISYTVENKSNQPLVQLPILVSLIDPDTQAPLAAERLIRDIAVAGSAQGSVTFQTAGLVLKTYTVVLQAELPADGTGSDLVTLKTASFAVTDRTPPQVDLRQPLNNGYFRGDATATVFAIDSLSSVRLVEISVDGGGWSAAPVHTAAESLYGNLLPGLAEGTHTVLARATDTWGNVGSSVQYTFVVDNTPPSIVVNGVADGSIYNTDRVPEVLISEPHLDRSFVTLNGAAFVSGTPVTAEGSYSLVVQATDKAGNSARRDTQFDIDKTPPAIGVAGVDQGQTYNVDMTPVIAATDVHLKSVTVSLNGIPFASGTTLVAEGDYDLTVTADDLAGNVASTSVRFAVDKTAPTVTFTSPVDGANLGASSTDVIGRTESNATVFLTAGAYQAQTLADAAGSFTFAAVPLSEGPNTISAHARDRAGNTGVASTITVNVVATELEGQILPPASVLVWIPRAGGDSHCHEHDGHHHDGDHDGHDDSRSRHAGEASAPSDQHTHHHECHQHSGEDLRKSVHSGSESALMRLVDDTLKSDEAYYIIVHDEDTFVAAMRSGEYSTFVIADLHPGEGYEACRERHTGEGECRSQSGAQSDPLLNISKETLGEIRGAVAAGAGLVLIKTHPDNSEHWEDMAGAKPYGVLPKLAQVVLPESPATNAGAWDASGYGLRLRLKGGTAVGQLRPDGTFPALVINAYGRGKVAWLAFNPADLKDSEGAKGVISKTVKFGRAASASTSSGSVVEVRWTASNLNPPLEVEFNESLPPGMEFVYTWGGTIASPTEATWMRSVNGTASEFRALVRLPRDAGDYVINGSISRIEAGVKFLMREKDLPVKVTEQQSDFATSAMDALINLNVAPKDRKRAQKAIEYVQQAIIAPQTSRAEIEAAIRFLAKAIESVDDMSASWPEAIGAIGMLLKSYQATWFALPQ